MFKYSSDYAKDFIRYSVYVINSLIDLKLRGVETTEQLGVGAKQFWQEAKGASSEPIVPKQMTTCLESKHVIEKLKIKHFHISMCSRGLSHFGRLCSSIGTFGKVGRHW